MMPGENLLKHMFSYKCETFDLLVVLTNPYHSIKLFLFVLRYKQAAFCYEELILAQPTIPLYHLSYSEVILSMTRIVDKVHGHIDYSGE
jgi:hypothetical protein